MAASRLLPMALALAAAPPLRAASPEKEYLVKQILRRMESDVLAFRDELERLAASRCDASTLAECAESNFSDCSSTYPGQRCISPDDVVVPACGDGKTCNALWSPFETDVRIPATLAMDSLGNPTNPQVIESICYSRTAEQYMIDNYKSGNQMYFGSALGTFRMIPARHSEVCGVYDPRRRPWFVAASSGPKDVVLVVDISTSMGDYRRMETAKKAAITIVDTLTVADRFSIIAFSNEATQLGEQGGLMRATRENKDRMIAEIDNLGANGATNFYAAFDAAFDAIDQTYDGIDITACNAAVLFLTDGQITEGPWEDGVVNLVNERVANIAAEYQKKTTIFTFSLGDKADHKVTKTIACNTGGIWTAVDDFTDDLVSAMSSYYKLYALGLGEGGDEDWVAWVEPYPFHTAGKMGTSASAPVYDRSVHPPQFLGVAAIDMWMDDIERILGEDAASSDMLDRFIDLSLARCPPIELTECEIDALRFAGGGEEATCGACGDATAAAGYAGILPDKCSYHDVDGHQSGLPQRTDLFINLWDNIDMLGKKYEKKACCQIGGTAPSDVCPLDASPQNNTALIVGICVAVAVPVLGLLIHAWKRRAIRAESATSNAPNGDSAEMGEAETNSDRAEMDNSAREAETILDRRDSIDPPAEEPRPARQPSIDPPAEEPEITLDEIQQRLSTISQNVSPVAAMASPSLNPDYNGTSSTSLDLQLLSGTPSPNARNAHELPSSSPQSSATKKTSSSSTSKNGKERDRMIDESCSIHPANYDVLFDGEGFAGTRPGNVKFRRKASELREWYKQSASKEEKKSIVDLLVDSVLDEGNRFLEKGEDGRWHKLTTKGAKKKVNQTLRRKP